MKTKVIIEEANGFKIIQNNGTFYIAPIPISVASKILSIDTADWDNKGSKFNGINRVVINSHKKDILEALENRSIILPNAIIAYIEHEYFSFTEVKAYENEYAKFGTIKFFKDPDKPDSKNAVILDGQHRFTALCDWTRSKGEDFPLYVVFFQAPHPKDAKGEEFEKLCLTVMSQVNKSRPLTDSEQKLIIARTKEVASNSKLKEFVTLIVKKLDADTKCPLKYSYMSKKPANKKATWLKLSVWINALTNSFNDSHNPRILQNVWVEASASDRKILEDSWEVSICVDMLGHGLKAVYGLVKNLWEKKPSTQRLYHNIGIRSIGSIIDIVNAEEQIYSRDPARKFYRIVSDPEKVMKKIQIALLPIIKIKWEASKTDPASMIEVKQQQDIDTNFSKSLGKLINEFAQKRKEWEEGKNRSPFEFDFSIKNSNYMLIYEQKVEMSHQEFEDYRTTIESGNFLIDYNVPSAIVPPVKKARKAKSK